MVGAGQSALETTALLHEAGADIEVVARVPAIRWLAPGKPEGGRVRQLFEFLKYPPTDVGPPGLNWIAGTPDVFHRMPSGLQPEIDIRCTLPAGSSWLVARLSAVTLSTGRTLTSLVPAGDGLGATLDDGSRREVDHVVFGTGYRIDVSKYGFLGPELLGSLRLDAGYPVLSAGLESSVPGLHFLGAPAAKSFGPVMRFVAGSWYCGPALARRVSGKPPLAVRFSW